MRSPVSDPVPAINPNLTYGEKVVADYISEITSGDLGAIQNNIADTINILNQLRSSNDSSEIKRVASVAITELQTAYMWAHRAFTLERNTLEQN